MTLINTQDALEDYCAALKDAPFITVDTEFLREKTYYPKLCLVQVSGPDGDAAAIDPLAGGIDLAPLYDLLLDESIVKVFHAARQDLEIFYNMTERVPAPVFDTQVAAMVCGFGESVGYNNLVNQLLNKQIDKSVQFTDWTRRPLDARMLDYALGDVTHLIEIYKILHAQLESKGRLSWVESEDAVLADPETYNIRPEEMWQKIKIRTDKPRVLAALKELAAWREREAQRRNQPKGWVAKDETLVDIAVHLPKTPKDLAKARGISEDMANGPAGKYILEAVDRALSLSKSQLPQPRARREQLPQDLIPAFEMLKMLLRINCAEYEAAPKLVASSDDLEALARDADADIPAMKGWRYDVFGKDAQDLLQGKLSLHLKNRQVHKAYRAD